MKDQFSLAAAAAAIFVSTVSAQHGGQNGGQNGWNGASSGAASPSATYSAGNGGPSCLGNCWAQLGSVSWSTGGGLSSLCSNATAISTMNSCISSSSCDDSDKESTYQVIAQICANTGNAISASPEASFSATSGGSAYPTTNSAWSSYAAAFATITGSPTADPFNSTNHPTGWAGGQGYGPFGNSGSRSGWGAWASDSTGSWTNGPWTSWWGTSGCPPSTWSGWTSGTWSASAPWTTWTGCTASTTASSVMTETVTTSGSSTVVTTTAFGIQVAQATTASGSAASATASGSSGERRAVAGMGVGLGGVLAAALLM